MFKILLISFITLSCGNQSKNSNNLESKKVSKPLTKDEFEILQKGNLEEIKKIINKDNVNETYYSSFALYEAMQRGDIEIIRYLLSLGADPNLRRGSEVLLTEAVKNCLKNQESDGDIKKNLEIIKFLVDNGAYIHYADLDKFNDPLYRAILAFDFPFKIKGVQFDILELFLEKDFKVFMDKEGRDSLNEVFGAISESYRVAVQKEEVEKLNRIVTRFIDKFSFNDETKNSYLTPLLEVQNGILLLHMINKKIPFNKEDLKEILKGPVTNNAFKKIAENFLNKGTIY